jgi:hypothetical protein
LIVIERMGKMISKNFDFGFTELRLSVDGICNIIGYYGSDELNLLKNMVSDILEEVRDISGIKAQYSVFKYLVFDREQAILNIGETSFNTGKIIFNQLKKSESLAVFLCTAGSEIGIMSRHAMLNKDLLRGYVLDVIGSEAAEAVADIVEQDIAESFGSAGYKITNRYSPGYCGWNVKEQKELFRLMPGNYCGIKLNDSSLMDPVKSVSGIIGIGRDVKKLPYTCNICDMEDCLYREKRR